MDCEPQRVSIASSEKLFDIPRILRTSREQLQQDEAHLVGDGDPKALELDRLRAFDDLRLPERSADDEIHDRCWRGRDTDDAGEGIVRVSVPDIHVWQALPQAGLERPPVRRQQVEIERRPAHAMGGERRRADQRERNPVLREDVDDLPEWTHTKRLS